MTSELIFFLSTDRLHRLQGHANVVDARKGATTADREGLASAQFAFQVSSFSRQVDHLYHLHDHLSPIPFSQPHYTHRFFADGSRRSSAGERRLRFLPAPLASPLHPTRPRSARQASTFYHFRHRHSHHAHFPLKSRSVDEELVPIVPGGRQKFQEDICLRCRASRCFGAEGGCSGGCKPWRCEGAKGIQARKFAPEMVCLWHRPIRVFRLTFFCLLYRPTPSPSTAVSPGFIRLTRKLGSSLCSPARTLQRGRRLPRGQRRAKMVIRLAVDLLAPRSDAITAEATTRPFAERLSHEPMHRLRHLTALLHFFSFCSTLHLTSHDLSISVTLRINRFLLHPLSREARLVLLHLLIPPSLPYPFSSIPRLIPRVFNASQANEADCWLSRGKARVGPRSRLRRLRVASFLTCF